MFSEDDVEVLEARKDVDGLIENLRSDCKSDAVRVSAARALGDIGDRNAVQPLIDVINDPDVEYHIKEASLISLGKIGNFQAIQALIGFLKDPYYRIQIYAHYGLYYSGENAVPHLIMALESRFFDDTHRKSPKRYASKVLKDLRKEF